MINKGSHLSISWWIQRTTPRSHHWLSAFGVTYCCGSGSMGYQRFWVVVECPGWCTSKHQYWLIVCSCRSYLILSMFFNHYVYPTSADSLGLTIILDICESPGRYYQPQPTTDRLDHHWSAARWRTWKDYPDQHHYQPIVRNYQLDMSGHSRIVTHPSQALNLLDGVVTNHWF